MRWLKLLICVIVIGGTMLSCGKIEPTIINSLMPEEVSECINPSMISGRVYVHDGRKLYDLLELTWVDPTETAEPDMKEMALEDVIEDYQKNPNAYILTITVEGYTKQISYGDPASTNNEDFTLFTNCRINEIHYLGEDLVLEKGKIYSFCHDGYWLLESTDGKVCSKVTRYDVFRYAHTYIVFGRLDNEGNLTISGDMGYTDTCSKDEFAEFAKKFSYYPKRNQEILDRFRLE